jgi:hypothetical protein
MLFIEGKRVWKTCVARDIVALLSRATPQWHLGKHQDTT